jgi:hypothetical protein
MDENCQDFLETAEKTAIKDTIKKSDYLIILEKYREACQKIDKMTTKDREKSMKFMNAQKNLKAEHEQAVTSLKQELKNTQRDLTKSHNIIIEKQEELLKCKPLEEKAPEPVVPKEEIRKAPPKEVKKVKKEKSQEVLEAEKLVAENYPEERALEILEKLINELARTVLNFKKISITYFEEYKLIILHRAFSRRVQKELGISSTPVINQVSNIILKTNFKYIHEIFAKRVLEASDVDRGIFKFFEKYVIEDDDQTRWNSFAITRFMNEYMTHTRNIEKLKDEIQKLESKRALAVEEEKKLRSAMESKEEIKKMILERKKSDKLIQEASTKKSESEIEVRRISKQYVLLEKATTKFLMQSRVVK